MAFDYVRQLIYYDRGPLCKISFSGTPTAAARVSAQRLRAALPSTASASAVLQ